jgi:small subunit ribosomal protein S17
MTERGNRKERVGTVVSDKMDKTVIVKVERNYIHTGYDRIVRDTKKYVAHDEKDECKVGDVVSIVETRPLSKTKRWRVAAIVERAK